MGEKAPFFFFLVGSISQCKETALMNSDLVGQELHISFFIDIIAAIWKCVITFLIIHT